MTLQGAATRGRGAAGAQTPPVIEIEPKRLMIKREHHMSCHVCHVMSYHVMSRLVLSCHIMSQ